MLRNSQTDWGWPSKLLHWIGALAVLVLLLHGWWMVHMAPRPERFANYTWHAAIGYDLLALLVLRLLWRWMNPVPAMPGDLKRWEVIAARSGHIGLYVLMFAASLTGWALAGTFKRPMTLDLFGLPIPQIVSSGDRALHNFFEESHMIASYLLAALIVVHIAGSLRHHFIKRNDRDAADVARIGGDEHHEEDRTVRSLPALTLVTAASSATSEPAKPYEPGLVEFMMLVQNHHAKLWLAGNARNWELADYQVDELKELLEDIAKRIPVYKDVPVGKMIEATTMPPIGDVEAAIKARDGKAFATAFDKLTAACNSLP